VRAEDERLGNAVQDDPQHERAAGLAGMVAVGRLLVTTAAGAVDQGLRAEEDHGAGEEPERDPALAGRRLERLLHELVGDRADEHPGAERHDQPEGATGERHPQGDRPADDERGASDRAPHERLTHGARSLLTARDR